MSLMGDAEGAEGDNDDDDDDDDVIHSTNISTKWLHAYNNKIPVLINKKYTHENYHAVLSATEPQKKDDIHDVPCPTIVKCNVVPL